jgi:hypothetical protein
MLGFVLQRADFVGREEIGDNEEAVVIEAF